MKTIIVYYALSGNTEWASQKLSADLGAETLRLEPEKAYPDKGFKKFFWGGKSAVMSETPPLRPYAFDAAKYDQIILGFPIWAGRYAPPIRTFLRDHGAALAGKRVAAFACQSGAGAEKAFARLEETLGRKLDATLVLIDPKEKPGPANEEKLLAFGGKCC